MTTLNFLHIIANLDALDASKAAKRKRSIGRGRGRGKETRFGSAPRPKSVQGGLASRCVSPAVGRPKSGKSLTFHLTDGRTSPTLSCSTRGLGPLTNVTSRMASTPKIHGKDVNSVNGRATFTDSGRNGGISPFAAPSEVKVMESTFMDVQPYVPGTTVWTVQSGTLRRVPERNHGFFHEGNVYLILHVNSPTERSLHYWIGSAATMSESKLVEDKAHYLDKIVSNAERFSREVQGHESNVFLPLFSDGIVYVEGKFKTCISKASAYDKRLYVVTGRKYPRAACVLPRHEYLKPENTLILDGSPRMYVWLGHKTGYVERTRTLRLARKMQTQQRKSKCHIVVIDEQDVQLNDAFKKKFEDQSFPIPVPEDKPRVDNDITETETEDEVTQVLYRVSGDQVLYDMPEHSRRPLKHCYLVTRDSYLLCRGPDHVLYMWVGHRAMEEEVDRAILRAKSFAASKGIPDSVPICRLREDSEPMDFKKCFCDWRDRVVPIKSLTKRYSVGNIGKALFSRTDRRTIATVNECWSDDTVGEFTGTCQTWVLSSTGLEPWDHSGIFTNNRCYIVLYTTEDSEQTQQVLYYWMGSKSSAEDRTKIVQVTLEKSSRLFNSAVMIRVLDGKEPPHFVAALNDWMIVYDGDEETREPKELQMFNVRECCDRGIRIQQVHPSWTNLNSSSSFVLLARNTCFLWYGKLSGSTEREATKELLRMLCSARMFSYEIVSEGKEPSSFFDVLGDKDDYQNEYKTKVLERRPPCLVLYNQERQSFEDVDAFFQEDLTDRDIMLLDVYDQILVWSGEKTAGHLRQNLFNISQTFIRRDPAGRCFDDISLWMVTQRHETMAFIKHFPSWSDCGYSDHHSYELLRKRLRQENAKIDTDENVVDTGFLGRPKYPYKTLIKKEVPSDVDLSNKQHHLSERQFRENLRLARADFYLLPTWKQHQILSSARLGPKPNTTSLCLDLDQV